MGFQRQVNVQPAPAVEGDFASANVRTTAIAGPGGLVTGAAGVIVGRFAFLNPLIPNVVNSFGNSTSALVGFVHREQTALITTFLAENSLVIPRGTQLALFTSGDFWVRNNGVAPVVMNDPVYVSYSDGSVANSLQTGAAYTASIGGVVTAAIGASFTATGSGTNLTTSAQTGYLSPADIVAGVGIPLGTTIVSQTSGTPGAAGVYVTSVATTAAAAACTSTSKVLVVSAITSGTVRPTDAVSGGTIIANTVVTAQLSGTTGGIGNYSLSGAAQSSASGAVTALSSVLTVSAITSGVLAIGQLIAGAGVTANSIITGLLTGAGGTGTYTLSQTSTVVSESMTTVAGVLSTKWRFMSAAAVGELAKISTTLFG
jgi:hypothetical protein